MTLRATVHGRLAKSGYRVARIGAGSAPGGSGERLPEEFERFYAGCRSFTMTSRERMYALYQAVRHVHTADIPGDVVECGVWRGGSSMLALSIGMGLLLAFTRRNPYLTRSPYVVKWSGESLTA